MSHFMPNSAYEPQGRSGLFLVAGVSGLSAAAAVLLLVHIAVKWYKRCRYREALRRNVESLPSTSQHTSDACDSTLFIFLVISELIKAICGLLNIRWAIDAGVIEPNSLCTVQGVLRQHSELGISFMSLFLAAKAFCVLVLRHYPSSSTVTCAIGLVFLLIALMQIVAVLTRDYVAGSPYYGSAGFGCWINEEYGTERIVFGYLWVWLAASLILIFYAIRVFMPYNINATCTSFDACNQEAEEYKERETDVAKLTYLHPAVFLLCVFPISLVRWIEYGGHQVAPGAVIFATVLFSLSGLFNVIVYAIKHPRLSRRFHKGTIDGRKTRQRESKVSFVSSEPDERKELRSPMDIDNHGPEINYRYASEPRSGHSPANNQHDERKGLPSPMDNDNRGLSAYISISKMPSSRHSSGNDQHVERKGLPSPTSNYNQRFQNVEYNTLVNQSGRQNLINAVCEGTAQPASPLAKRILLISQPASNARPVQSGTPPTSPRRLPIPPKEATTSM